MLSTIPLHLKQLCFGILGTVSRPISILTGIIFLITIMAIAEQPWVVSEDGAGPMKIGMTVVQLNTVLHEKFRKPAAKEDQACFYLEPQKQPLVKLMIEDGRLSRIDVNGRGVKTSTGIQVGDTEKHARQIYGSKLKVEPHKYIDNGHYLTARSSDRKYGIRFETEDGKITSYYAGRFESIQYVEGCL